MIVFSYGLAILILLLLFVLERGASKLIVQSKEEIKQIEQMICFRWPKVALIVPVSGGDVRIKESLRSLLKQDYNDYTVVLVTETSSDPCCRIIAELKSEYPGLLHVTAGSAEKCGQKNFNLLAAVRAVQKFLPDCYVFCDSTHAAPPHFLQALVSPIACGQASICTGYHEVVPLDTSFTSLGYAISVLFMRLLQALAVFTQPWGGALAITKNTFEKAGIASLWAQTVVDDCALVSYLNKLKIHVQLQASALLTTTVKEHKSDVWRAWMERQILFPRFCVPGQWWLLGLLLALFFFPTFFCLEDFFLELQKGLSWRLLFPVLWFVAFLVLILRLKPYVQAKVSIYRFLGAFFLALWTFLRVYLGTIGAKTIVWHGKVYLVGRGGVVLRKQNVQDKQG
ncbi:MAG: glycosyltransferase [Desulfovibrio sp.]|nr:glycosyltransferase [Desulfovibrio sp.]